MNFGSWLEWKGKAVMGLQQHTFQALGVPCAVSPCHKAGPRLMRAKATHSEGPREKVCAA